MARTWSAAKKSFKSWQLLILGFCQNSSKVQQEQLDYKMATFLVHCEVNSVWFCADQEMFQKSKAVLNISVSCSGVNHPFGYKSQTSFVKSCLKKDRGKGEASQLRSLNQSHITVTAFLPARIFCHVNLPLVQSTHITRFSLIYNLCKTRTSL